MDVDFLKLDPRFVYFGECARFATGIKFPIIKRIDRATDEWNITGESAEGDYPGAKWDISLWNWTNSSRIEIKVETSNGGMGYDSINKMYDLTDGDLADTTLRDWLKETAKRAYLRAIGKVRPQNSVNGEKFTKPVQETL